MSTPYDYITINTPTGGTSTTYTGTQISVNTPAISDVTKAEVALKAKQTLNGYSYPWPGGAGKNLNNPATWDHTNPVTQNGVKWTLNPDGSVTANGTAGTSQSQVRFGLTGQFSGNYYFCGGQNIAYDDGDIYIYNSSTSSRCKKWDGTTASESSVSGANLQQVQLNNTNTIWFNLRIKPGRTANNVTFYPMIMASTETDTTFAPYENICPITGSDSVTLYKRSAQSSLYASSYYKYLNTTVYNGSFEYITGKVTKTYALITLNSSDLTWAVYNDSSTSRAFRATITNMKSLSHSSYDSTQCFCTQAKWTTGSERLSFGNFYYSYGYVYFPDYNSKRFNTVDEFTAWLDLQESRGTPVTILYPLSTPTETTVSTTTIKTLAGQNYFDTSSTAANRLPLTMTVLQSSFTLPRPLNFAVQREDIYAGQYTTCTGATRADLIGWKYSDMTWSWDGMKQSDVEKLCGLTGECTLIFDDPSGDTIEESFIRSSVVSMRCRNKFEDEYWWTGVSCSIKFISSHTD